MSLRPNLLHLLSSATICLLNLAAAPVMSAEPKVYRCGPAGSQWFSQIPCAADSEEVIIEDHHMFSETPAINPQAENPGSENGNEEEALAEADASGKAQAFIVQLEKQRSEQLADFDRRIDELESQSAATSTDVDTGPDGSAESSTDNKEVLQQLAALKRSRQSMVSEYDAMINAARQRIATP